MNLIPMVKLIISVIICAFIVLPQIFGQSIRIELAYKKAASSLESDFTTKGVSYRFKLYDVNDNGVFNEMGVDAINIINKQNGQLGVCTLTDSLILTLYDTSFRIVTKITARTKEVFLIPTSLEKNASLVLSLNFPEIPLVNYTEDLRFDDKVASLNTLDFDYYYVYVWSPSCPPCVAAMPLLKELEKRNIALMYLCNEDEKETAKDILSKYDLRGIHSTISREQMNRINAYWFPTGFLFDKSQKFLKEAGPYSLLNEFYRNSKQ